MLGGLLENGSGAQNAGVPGLRNIPLVGGLFRGRAVNKNQRVLLLLLRPRIIRNDADATKLTREIARDARRASTAIAPVSDDQYPNYPASSFPFDGANLDQPFDAGFIDSDARSKTFPAAAVAHRIPRVIKGAPWPSLTCPSSLPGTSNLVLQGDALICGPDVTVFGLREARRRMRRPLRIEKVEREAFETLLNAHYHHGSNSGDGDETDLSFDLEARDGGAGLRDLLEDATEAPVIELVNQLLRRTVRAAASDLHVEPYENGLRARVRVDGMLRSVMDRSDVPVRRVIIAAQGHGGAGHRRDPAAAGRPHQLALWRSRYRRADVDAAGPLRRADHLAGAGPAFRAAAAGQAGAERHTRPMCCAVWRGGPTGSFWPPGRPAAARPRRFIRCCSWPISTSAIS